MLKIDNLSNNYLKDADEMIAVLAKYVEARILWIDTEIADFLTRSPKLSLIQILDDSSDRTGQTVTILDVIEQAEIIDIFIKQIMFNPAIEKVFHNASYDLKYLGKTKAKNITCTLEIAKKIPHYILPLPNLSLKTLAETLCNIPEVDKSQQISDWGQRPLTDTQLNYAKMDTVYLAMVHHQLLQLTQLSNPDPSIENVAALAERYLELKQQLQLLDSEFVHVEARLKTAMQAQNLSKINDLKLLQSNRKTVKVEFSHLAKITQEHGLSLDFPIALTQKLQKQLGEIIAQLSVQVETSTSWRLQKQQDESADDSQSSNTDF